MAVGRSLPTSAPPSAPLLTNANEKALLMQAMVERTNPTLPRAERMQSSEEGPGVLDARILGPLQSLRVSSIKE